MRTCARATLLVLLVGSFASPGWAARSGRIVGKVKASDGTGVLGAVISIFQENQRGGTISFTRSDRSGGYTIANLVPGAYHVQIHREGYEPLARANVTIEPGRTTTMDVILQTFLDLVSGDDDPRNWSIRTVLRSTSDRRLIFRHFDGNPGVPGAVTDGPAQVFSRTAALNVSSSAGLNAENYSIFPANGNNGLVSNFAFTEPIGEHGRMIFSGQLNSGYDSMWRVRNTYQYRPESGRDVRMSIGYGRLSLNGASPNLLGRPTQFFAQDPAIRESGVQALALSIDSRSKVLDPITLEYGLDYSRLNSNITRSIFSPYFQVVVTPTDSWTIKGGMVSRRLTDGNSVVLADGEVVNLTEPTYIAQVNGDIRFSQFKHSEVAVTRDLGDETSVEVAGYEDHMVGPGTPFAITDRTSGSSRTRVAQLTQEQSAHHGVRVAVNRQFIDFLAGSIAYVYGTGTALSGTEDPVSAEALAGDLLSYLHRSYYHSFTSQVTARVPKTGTRITTVMRWYPGTSLSPIDLFYDRQDTLTKGIHVFVRQAIPLPVFMGTPGRWEALVDLRNVLDQGHAVVRTAAGNVSLTRSPRSVRFGLNLNLN
jgi:hypothetical protein